MNACDQWGSSNNHRFIAVPFGCKLMLQISRESSLCTDSNQQPRYGRYSCECGPFHLILYMLIFSKTKKKRRSFPQTGQLSPTTFRFVILTCFPTSQFFQRKQHSKCISKMTPSKRLSSSLIPGPSQCGQEILQGFGAEHASSTRIFEDNQACIAMSENTVHRERHIGVRKYYVRELVVDKLVKLMPCGTTEMGADALTKSLPYPPFRTHSNTMLDATSLRASV